MFYTSKSTALPIQGNTRFCMRNQMIYKQSHINENKQAVLEFYALKDHTINNEELQDRKSCVKNLPSFKIWPSFVVCWM
jgi:hypothetical protein